MASKGPETDAEHAHLNLPKKSTMVKHRVGCVKTTTYNLPTAANHVYGAPSNSNNEGAGAIISNWVTSNPSLGKESSKLIVYSNILAIRNGCVTARAMRKYAAEHPNIRRKEALPSSSARVDSRFEGPFGCKTKVADDKMDSIIQARYTNFNAEDADYPNTSTIQKSGSFPKPRPTIASTSVTLAREMQAKKGEKKRFCMKRFQNIKGTFHLPDVEVEKIPDKPKHSEVFVHIHHDVDAHHHMMHPEEHHGPAYAHGDSKMLVGNEAGIHARHV